MKKLLILILSLTILFTCKTTDKNKKDVKDIISSKSDLVNSIVNDNTSNIERVTKELIELKEYTSKLEKKINSIKITNIVNKSTPYIAAAASAVGTSILFNWNIVWSLLLKVFLLLIKKPLLKLWEKIKERYRNLLIRIKEKFKRNKK